jgi:hypothetical protein
MRPRAHGSRDPLQYLNIITTSGKRDRGWGRRGIMLKLDIGFAGEIQHLQNQELAQQSHASSRIKITQ